MIFSANNAVEMLWRIVEAQSMRMMIRGVRDIHSIGLAANTQVIQHLPFYC